MEQEPHYTILGMLIYLIMTFIGLVICWLLIVIIAWCIYPRLGRRYALNTYRFFYKHCCFRLKCNTIKESQQELAVRESLDDIIDKFKHGVQTRRIFMKNLEKENHIHQILYVLNTNVMEFQFSIMPTGSLREGFGKLQPSKSVLASDYDMMLIPEDCYASLSDGTRYEKEYDNLVKAELSIFEAVQPQGIDEAYCWLKLKDNLPQRHQHWRNYTIFKKMNGEDISVISNDLIRKRMKSSLEEASANLFNTYSDVALKEKIDYNFESSIEIQGPAVTIKIKESEGNGCGRLKSIICKSFGYFGNVLNLIFCCMKWFPLRHTPDDRDMFAFYGDFILAICCNEWPKVAGEWITRCRSWPSSHVVNKIKNSVNHFVPKPSTSLSPISFVQTQAFAPGEQPLVNDTYATILKGTGAEFRFSFSQAETILSDVVPKQAKEVYLAFKSTIKRLQEQINCTEKIESFALKSIFYRTLETMDENQWHMPDTSGLKGYLLMELFKTLHTSLHEQSCPHYWISSLNLFQKFKLDDEAINDELAPMEVSMLRTRDILLFELQKVLIEPAKYVLDDWVEHNRFLLDYCWFGGLCCCCCPCLPPCEKECIYVGRSHNLFGVNPSPKEYNESFAVY